MDKIDILIDEAINFMRNYSSKGNFTWGDGIALFVAFISVLGTYFTIRSNFKLKKTNARIEWIQKVREITAELISQYYLALNKKDSKEVTEIVRNAQKQVELLSLHFGPEHERWFKKKTSNVYDSTTNYGKNDLIVKMLNELSTGFSKYLSCVENHTVEKTRERAINAYNDLSKNIIDVETIETVVDGQTITYQELTYDNEAEKAYQTALNEFEKERQKYEKLEKQLQILREVIRIYLKIEWNEAKHGK